MSKIPKNIDKIPFFFIIGRPRSGTTLLQTLMDAHPNVIIPPESAVIKECYERFKSVDHWDDERLIELINFLFDIRKFNVWNINKDTLAKTLLQNSGKYNFGTIIRIIYCQYQSSYIKTVVQVFGDKNPRYSKYPLEFKKIFPEAKFIHVVRDYRDHILSMKRVKLLNGNLPLISFLWRKSQKDIFNLIKSYPEHVLSLKYEDFVENPHKYLLQICDFLEIDFERTVLDYREQKDEITKKDLLKTNESFHGNLFKPITSENVEKWKSKMNVKDIKRADYYVGKYAELSGYKRQYTNRQLADLLIVITGYIYILSYYFLLFIIRIIPIRIRKKLKRKMSKFFPIGHIDTL